MTRNDWVSAYTGKHTEEVVHRIISAKMKSFHRFFCVAIKLPSWVFFHHFHSVNIPIHYQADFFLFSRLSIIMTPLIVKRSITITIKLRSRLNNKYIYDDMTRVEKPRNVSMIFPPRPFVQQEFLFLYFA